MRIAEFCLSLMAWIAMSLPSAVFADASLEAMEVRAQSQSPNRINDVALQPGGILTGQLMGSVGQPQGNARILLKKDGTIVASTQSSDSGHFSVAGLSGGVYEVVADESSSMWRVWQPETAPPGASGSMAIFSGPTVRGQTDEEDSGHGRILAAGGTRHVRNRPYAVHRSPARVRRRSRGQRVGIAPACVRCS